jgi:hypothetical protein
MPHSWFVTFEVPKRGMLPKRRSPRVTKTFENEEEAKSFAQSRFDEGLIVHAGTLNPHSPRQLISSRNILSWLHDPQEPDMHTPDGPEGEEGTVPNGTGRSGKS